MDISGILGGNQIRNRLLEGDESLSGRANITQMETELAQEPVVERAAKFKQENSVCRADMSPFPIWKTSSTDFGSYSIGLELYFLFLQQMIFLFFLIASISIYTLYNNTQGHYFNVHDPIDANAAASIGNLSGKASEDDYFLAWFSDFYYTLIALVLIPCFVLQALSRIQKKKQDQIKITDFAIEVKGFPEEGTRKKDLLEHFKCEGGIHEIYIARRYNHLLFGYRKRALAKIKSHKRAAIVKAKGKDPQKDKKYLNACREIEKFDNELAAEREQEIKNHKELPMLRAYIVFKSKRDRAETLKKYSRWYFCKYPSGLLLQVKDSKYKLKVRKAPNPSDILFENLEVSNCYRRTRQVLTFLSLAAIMCISVGLIYAVKTTNDHHPVCTENYSGSLEEAEQKYTEDDDIFCWCKTKTFGEILSDEDLLDFCADYISETSLSISVQLLGIVIISIVNLILAFAIKFSIRFERMTNLSKQQRRRMIRLFWAFLVNTGLIILIVNANLQAFSIFNGIIFDGNYKDFTAEWYLKVGWLYMKSALVAIFSPHCMVLMILYPIWVMKRRCCWKRYKTQYDLNTAFRGGIFEITLRMAQILMLICVMFLFSGGMPVMNIICFFALLSIYWTDKYLMVRFYRKPPFYSEKFYITAMKLIYVGVILHCLFSAYMYGSPDIFQDEDENDGVLYRYFETEAGIGFTIMMMIAVSMFSLSWLTMKAFKKLIRYFQHDSWKMVSTDLEDVIEKIKAQSDIVSYDILANSKYSYFVEAINDIAENAKSIRRQSSENPEVPVKNRIPSNKIVTIVNDDVGRMRNSSSKMPSNGDKVIGSNPDLDQQDKF